MSSTLAQTEAKIDSFVEGNIKPWLNARVNEAVAEADSLRSDAEEWRELMKRVEGNETWTASDIETHYGMFFGRPFGGPAHLPRLIMDTSDLKVGQGVVAFQEDGTVIGGFITQIERENGQLSHLEFNNARNGFEGTANGRTTALILVTDAPEAETVTAEDIRNSEPGSTWDGPYGSTWEWNGRHMQIHSFDGTLMGEWNLDEFFTNGRTVTRSTASPRGTYTEPEPELPGEPIEVEDIRVGDRIWYCLVDGDPALNGYEHVVAQPSYWVEVRHYYHPFRLIERPKATPEDIRNSEPGSTWEDSLGHACEWDGEQLRLQAGDRLVSIDQLRSHVFDHFGPWVRSNKPSIGTYGPGGEVTVR